ncbi:MAG: SWIM zinc finger domain-containing protein [Pyrinomonadaceae bacterium]|nr:SWIM zinc finger domain-containing protein [Pyrinomonadaceae bacterium]
MSRTRAGRKSWETRISYHREVGNTVEAFASADWKYDAETTKKMVIERTAKATGKTEVITFSMAYGELSMWLDKVFVNISERGFSDMLAETFFQGAELHTPKATYKLWVAPVKEETKEQNGGGICINERLDDFFAAVERGANSDLQVFGDWERNAFVVVNRANRHEYRIKIRHADGNLFASCQCADFNRRNRICKHIAVVLREVLEHEYEELEAEFYPFAAVTFATNFKDNAEPVTRRFRTQKEAVQSVERSAEIAGSCFQYGRVFNRAGAEVYAIEVADFEEAFTYDFDCQY